MDVQWTEADDKIFTFVEALASLLVFVRDALLAMELLCNRRDMMRSVTAAECCCSRAVFTFGDAVLAIPFLAVELLGTRVEHALALVQLFLLLEGLWTELQRQQRNVGAELATIALYTSHECVYALGPSKLVQLFSPKQHFEVTGVKYNLYDAQGNW